MKIGVYQKSPTNMGRVYLSMSRSELALMGDTKRVDVVCEKDMIIIKPGKRLKLKNSLPLPIEVARFISTAPDHMKGRPISYGLISGKIVIKVSDARRIFQFDSGEDYQKRFRKDEPLYNPKDNPSSEVKHFKSPMSMKTIYKVAAEVDTYFSDGKYVKGHNDLTIAKDLDVSELSVSKIREEIFGAIIIDLKQQKIDGLLEQIEGIQNQLKELSK